MVYDAQEIRRKILKAIGLVPAALTVGTSNQAWSLTNRVNIRVDKQYRYITANGIPNHSTGNFPNRNNPNRISAQRHEYRVSANPRKARSAHRLGLGPFGVAVNGVPFEPFAAEFWNRDFNSGWQYEAMTGFINLGLDKSNAHVQPNGSYHYHGIPNGLIESWTPKSHSALLGYAADGFPIYAIYGASGDHGEGEIKELRSSWQLKQGSRSSGPGGSFDGRFVQDFEYIENRGDLDRFNGKFTITSEYPNGTYAYFLTTEFPFIPRYFAGIPDESFSRRPSLGGNRPPPPEGKPPPPGGRKKKKKRY